MRRLSPPLLLAALLLVMGLAGGACTGASPPATSDPVGVERGEVIEVVELPAVPIAELESLAAQAGLDETPRHGLDVRRVRYGTVDAHGAAAVATGTVLLPSGAAGALPVLSVQHGTQTSRLADEQVNPELLGPGLLFGAQGYAVVGADYLGLGGGDHGVHPYYHAASEASVTLDLLRAARRVIAGAGATTSQELFLAGYSQGAHVTMALHRVIESEDTGFAVSGSVAMAGAYNLDEVNVPHAVAEPAASTPLYLAYAVLGLNPLHRFASDLDDVFTEPYEDGALELFDGTRSATEIAARLPRDLAELFDPGFLEQLQSGRGPFFTALRANNVDDFTPAAPVLLVHARGDADVPFSSSQSYHRELLARGADVELVALGADLDHESAAAPAFLAGRDWIAERRRELADSRAEGELILTTEDDNAVDAYRDAFVAAGAARQIASARHD